MAGSNAFSEDQLAIVDAVREFTATELAPFANERDRTKHFPLDTLERAGLLGLGGIYVGEDVGGSALDRLTATLVFEELAKGDTTIAAYLSIHNMVAWMIDRYGDDAQRERWLPGLTSLVDRASYCLTEPSAGSDAAAITTTARREGDEYVLNGVKQFISGAGVSAVYLVFARTGEPGARGISAIVVPAEASGLSFGPDEQKMGWRAQPTRQVVLDGVRVPVGHRLGDEGDGFPIALSGLDGGRVNIAACSLGGAQWALDRALRHVRERETFGRPLAEHQTVRFTLADMATELHAARLLVHDAAAAIDDGVPDATARCAMAKRFATDAAFTVANAALQLHGGYGYLSEFGIERVVRDLRVHQILEGTNEVMRMIVARRLLGGR
ncbi:acyl-CoA dehydrogenase family protein [Agromyces sp. H3Y2-19a]|uniref:acyl-CoA dehydrogenase family protein n=1 Tax=Agromyces TaxID=33877 RepID=UPI001E574592|nr:MULTISPECIES: acyl-CoA dehydrogenase family protein [Agromyces]MCD5348210.1 acyl-CoA dehydrogenase family protein [Agromyces sp. S2-1-8]MDF0514185.1 acyl-CoA dehydrogenase family protein [Agromyces chromiiresistens]